MKYIVLFLALVLLVGAVSAVPTMLPVTEVTNHDVLFNATGAGTVGWFEWGATDGGSYKWKTPNKSYTAWYSDFWEGSPLLTGHTYYVRACDDTGCGNQEMFVMNESSKTNATSYGTGFTTLLHSGFDLTTLPSTLATPFTSAMPGGAPVTWGMLFFFIIGGYWLRHRDITVPSFIAIISGGLFWMVGSTLGVPPEFTVIGQGLMYAAIAGMAVGWFSR